MDCSQASAVPRLCLVTLAIGMMLSTGCTMCPDPYDYSGPVPNGSAPQNDFRARSNGILPISGVPRPWPPVVNVEPDRADERGVTVPALEMADDASPPEAAGVIQPATAAVPEVNPGIDGCAPRALVVAGAVSEGSPSPAFAPLVLLVGCMVLTEPPIAVRLPRWAPLRAFNAAFQPQVPTLPNLHQLSRCVLRYRCVRCE